jgi:hypothetical protein
MQMQREYMIRFPQEIEDKIREYLVSGYEKLNMLMYKNTFIERKDAIQLTYQEIMFHDPYAIKCVLSWGCLDKFTKNQLEKVYINGCVEKIFQGNSYYREIKDNVLGLFPNGKYIKKTCKYENGRFIDVPSIAIPLLEKFKDRFMPSDTVRYRKKQLTKPEYIRRIFNFCESILDFPHRQNKCYKLADFCENLVYQLSVCIIYIHRKNESKKNQGKF